MVSLSSFIGVDGTNMTPNSGRIQINLKPREERTADASDIIRRLQPEVAKVQGIQLFMKPVQDITVEDRVSRTQYQYSIERCRFRRTFAMGTTRGRKIPQIVAGARRCSDRPA